ncbi:hypothetical protein DID88_003937 [Monilinia fructigena]|uniref:Uncharacterized protein n=1 Tax=Monilinia fructigena TaxID=38457 RepID=A0A395IT78_9HELO|nr:hypothetical protein DID88_003937 [Monilinia fructigena]
MDATDINDAKTLSAGLHPIIQLHLLDDGEKAIRMYVGAIAYILLFHLANGRRTLGVLDIEYRLSMVNEYLPSVTLLVLHALLVDSELHVVYHLVDDLACILQANSHASSVGLGRKPLHEIDRVIFSVTA